MASSPSTTRSEPSRDRRGPAVAVLAGFTAALLIVFVVLAIRMANAGLEPEGQNWVLTGQLMLGCFYVPVGVFLLSRRAGAMLGALFVAIGSSLAVQALATELLAYATFRGEDVIGAAVAAWLTPGAGLVGLGLLGAVVPLVLPIGALPNRGWRPVLVAAIVFVAVTATPASDRFDRVPLLSNLGEAALAAIATAGLGLAVARWNANRHTREEPLMAWLAVGVAVAWLAVVPVVVAVSDDLPGHGVVFPLLLLATVPLLLVPSLLAVVRHEVGAIDVASHRFLEWVLLGVGVVLTYSCLVAGLGELVGANGPTWLLVASTGLIALLVEPGRRAITRSVDRVVYGMRDDPLELVRNVMGQVTSTVDVDQVPPALVRTIAQSMRLEHVAIDANLEGRTVRLATWGAPTAASVGLPLVHASDVIGELTVGWSAGSSLRRRDRATLDDIVPHVSVAVSWVCLTWELRRSTVAIASSREEERRRLRRDLHDGVGPALTGMSLGIRTAIRQLERTGADPPPSAPIQLLRRIADEIDNSVVEVKRIVRDLRPTALDDQTLSEALTEFARRFDGMLDIHLDLTGADAALPAAVEIASYRIATEAVTNVVRHAGARNCWVRVSGSGPVEIDVTDDGVGILPNHGAGIGLQSMEERCIELGGAFSVSPNPPHGTRVHVAIPATAP